MSVALIDKRFLLPVVYHASECKDGIGDVLHLPLNSLRMQKLTENYVVSNAKIKDSLGIKEMPVRAKDGLRETIKSFVHGSGVMRND